MESWLSDGESLRVEAERSRAEARELQESARQTRARAEVQVERARRLAAEMITIHLASSLVAADVALQLGEHVYLIERPRALTRESHTRTATPSAASVTGHAGTDSRRSR